MKSERIHSIDAFRGLAIAGMVIANFIAGVEWMPAWLKHAPDAGFTIIDLVAPMFIFAIGLTFGLSATRRFANEGALKATLHFVTRFFAVLGIGALLSAGEIALNVDNQTVNWGVLQAIGVAGLVTLVFIRSKTWVRLLIAMILLAVYQILLQTLWLQPVLSSPHGGIYGSISWSAMLLLATVLADLFHQSQKGLLKLGVGGTICLILGLALTLWFPISKNRVSAPYVLLSLGLSSLVFIFIHILVEKIKLRMNLITLWGRNPMVMYVTHMLLLGIVYLPGIPAFYAQAPLWLVLVEGGVILGVLTGLAWQLDRHDLRVIL